MENSGPGPGPGSRSKVGWGTGVNVKKKRNNFAGFNKSRKRFKAGNGENQIEQNTNLPAGRVFFQDSELFTAPTSIDDHQLQVVSLNNPVQYPGWRLYFPHETFVESSQIVVQIKSFEGHIIRNPGTYDQQDILKKGWFSVSFQCLANDSEFTSSWKDINEHFQNDPKLVLNCLGMAMHSLITKMVKERVNSQENNFTKYQSKRKNIEKITARPLCPLPVTCLAELKHESYDRLIVVHGYVDSVSSVRSECSWIAYRCNRCGREQTIWQGEYYPTKPLRCRLECNAKRNFTPLRSSPYTKIDCLQSLQMREIKIGYSHLTIPVDLRGGLVNCVGPGNEVTVIGILKMKALDTKKPSEYQKKQKHTDFIEALNVIKHTNTGVKYRLEAPKDLEMVHTISKEPNCFKLLVNSLAQDLCGHEMVKAAVLLSLFGGSGSQLSDEGDLHVLVVGDPGVGKSDLLLNAANATDLGRFVSGKNNTSASTMSQNACLNTANLFDAESMHASSTGHFCVDDFEKLLSLQESLIHTLQTNAVTARNTKAVLSFSTKKSLIAATNPVSGHYDPSKLVRENVRLHSSLLSLFHLVYVLTDKADKDRDSSISEHVKALHSGMKKGNKIHTKKAVEQAVGPEGTSQNEKAELHDRLKVTNSEHIDLLPTILLNKYIGYAQQCTKPLLKKEASQAIKEFYLELRNEATDTDKFLVTTRQLDGLIRLSQARARVELCSAVSHQHTEDILEVIRHSARLNVQTELNESTASTSRGSQVQRFIKMLHHRTNALGRKVFELEELKDIASRVGLTCGVTNLIELINMQGYLLKKGPNLYEVITQ